MNDAEKLAAIRSILEMPTTNPGPTGPTGPGPVVTPPYVPPATSGVNEFPIQQGWVYGNASQDGAHQLDYSSSWIGINAANGVPFSIPVICPPDKTTVKLTFLKGNSDVGQARRFTASWNGQPINDIIIADVRTIPMGPNQRGVLTLTAQMGGSFVIKSSFF